MTVSAAAAGALRGDPGFRRYLAARVVSTAGTLITAVVLPVLVYRLTGSPVWTAAVVVAEALPHLLLAPLAASIAARRSRTAVLVGTDLAGAALLAGIPLAWAGDALSGWQVLVVAGALQATFLLRDAAHRDALQALTGPELTDAGSTALGSATGLVELMVPPLAGLAVTVVAPAPLLALDAVSFLASALLVRAAVRSRPGERPAHRHPAGRHPAPGRAAPRTRAALRVLRDSPPARTVALAGTLHAAAGAVYLAMLLPWADRQLGVPPAGDARLALVVSCWGFGVIVGCSVCPALIRRFGLDRVLRTGLTGSLACGCGVLLSSHWLPAVLAALLWGANYTVAMTAAKAALGDPARPAARLLWRGAGPVTGAAVAGAVAVAATPRAALAVAVVLLAAAALAARRSNRGSRSPRSSRSGGDPAGRPLPRQPA